MVITITGSTTTGKSSSLRFLTEEQRKQTIYLNFDASKTPPFAMGDIKYMPVDNANSGAAMIEQLLAKKDRYKYIIIDTLTSLLNLNVSQNILTSSKAFPWGGQAIFFEKLISMMNSSQGKEFTWIVLAHAAFVDLNTDEMAAPKLVHKIMAQGSPGKAGGGMESNFGIVLSTRVVKPEFLKEYIEEDADSKLLTITKREEKTKNKYVYQVQQDWTGDTYALCSPMGLWGENTVFMDSNIALLLEHFDTKTEILNY